MREREEKGGLEIKGSKNKMTPRKHGPWLATRKDPLR